jgi:DNA-binding CsgD family transcriptional regulator
MQTTQKVEPLTAEKFLKDVVIPSRVNQIGVEYFWALRDREHNFVLSSNSYARKFIGGNHQDILGKNLDYLVDSVGKSCVEITKQQDNKIITNPLSNTSELNIYKIKEVVEVELTTRTAIVFNNECIAVDVIINPLTQNCFDLDNYLKSKSINIDSSTQAKPAKIKLSQREETILYLLILRKTQAEVADLLRVSRSRVSQLVARICEKFGLYSNSARVLVDYAVANNYHESIPVEFFIFFRF